MSEEKVAHLPRGRKPDLGDGGMKDTITGIIEAFGAHNIDPARPFTGQEHTDEGARGQQEIHGVRMRDLADCLAISFVLSAGLEGENTLRDKIDDVTLTYNDLYKLDLSVMDPVALIQNLTCEVEKRMGIFPNVPDLTSKDKE